MSGPRLRYRRIRTAPTPTVPRGASAIAVAASVVCALATLACVALAWWVLLQVRIGPVVATLTASHGVHSGDLLGVVSLALGLAFATGAYVSARHPERVVALVSSR